MKIIRKISGFTLIELLVVITIIGILATWAVSVYTSQIQKARDTTRITDMNALKWGLEQTFQDMWMYPGKASTMATTTTCDASAATSSPWDSSVYCTVKLGFLNSLPKDPKDGKSGNGSALVYTYNTRDMHGVANQQYELSTWVEADWFKTSKAANSVDGWNDANRVEFGIPWVWIHTCTNGTTACSGNSSASTISAASCTVLNATTWQVVIRWNCN